MQHIKVLITGTTGMVGEGVMLECLDHPEVAQVVVVSRKPGGRTHPKLREVLLPDFFDPARIQPEFADVDACFFCLGVSSIGLSEADYTRTTRDLTLGFAQALARASPGATFTYVSGKSTDGTEQGKTMWARVKGATENALLRLFPKAVMFRPAMMKATPGQVKLKGWYRAIAWIYPIGRALAPASFCTLREVAVAMIEAALHGAPKRVLEVPDIVALARIADQRRST